MHSHSSTSILDHRTIHLLGLSSSLETNSRLNSAAKKFPNSFAEIKNINQDKKVDLDEKKIIKRPAHLWNIIEEDVDKLTP